MIGHITGEMLQHIGVATAGRGAAHHFGESIEIGRRQGLIIGPLLGASQQTAKALSPDLAVRHQNKLVLRMKLHQRGAADRVLR